MKLKGRKTLLFIFVTLTVLSVIMTACASPATTEQVQTAIAQTMSAQTQTSTPTVTASPTEDGFATINAAITMTLGAMTQTPVPPSNTQTLVAQGVSGTLNAPSNTPTNTPANAPTTQPSQTSTPMPLPSFTSTSTLAPLPTNTAAPIQSFGTVLDTTQWSYAADFYRGCTPESHSVFINRFNALYVYPSGITRLPKGGTLTAGPNQAILFVTGNYRDADPTHNGRIKRYCVEGDTGTWLIPSGGSETIKTGLAYIVLNNWNGETEPRPGNPALVKGDIQAEACSASNKIVADIKAHMGEEEVFALMDDAANANPDARTSFSWYSTYHAIAGKSLVWTASGEVGMGWAPITSADHKTLYVATKSGELEVMHAFSGIQLCSPYPGYANLTPVSKSASVPRESDQKIANSAFAKLVTDNRTGALFERLGLEPSTVYESGTHDTKWNTFIVTTSGVSDPNLMKITELNTSDGYRVLYFVMTDSVTSFSGEWAVYQVPDPFNVGCEFDSWWPGACQP